MEIRYAESDEISLAYCVAGDSELPLIFIPGIVSNLAFDASAPSTARFYEALGRFSRFVRWDRRGTGLSDQSVDPLPLAEQARDLEAIRGAVGFERFALVAYSQGTALAARYAAANPDRVSHLILLSGAVCNERDPTREHSGPLSPWERLIAETNDFPRYVARLIEAGAPGLSEQASAPVQNQIMASVTPRGMRQLLGQLRELDLRPFLAEIRVPTLIVHAKGDRLFPVGHGRYFAQHIEGARYEEIESDFHMHVHDEATLAETLTAIEDFLTGNVVHTADRTMATVLFTDIVDSTRAQQERGDDAWRTLRKGFEANSARLVEQFGGRVVQFTGDGVMASFPSASQALRAARALGADARALGVAIRAGVHSGEAYTVGDQLFGTCVTVASRVADCAGSGDVFTTETVQDLVAGAGFAFRDAGTFELKGLGSRRLLAID